MSQEIIHLQLALCNRFQATAVAAPWNKKVGISRSVKGSAEPINALRIAPDGDTSGWYIWAGDWSDDAAFFAPLHIEHLSEWCPQIVPYLHLPPGWIVLLAAGHEDVCYDPQLR
jgi:hypothetical protein